jgi:flagellar biosynthesis protein
MPNSLRVAAKNNSSVAEEILRLAEQHDIPLRSDPGLASALAQLEFGPPSPPELFRAVAEVLAFVYQMNDTMGGKK